MELAQNTSTDNQTNNANTGNITPNQEDTTMDNITTAATNPKRREKKTIQRQIHTNAMKALADHAAKRAKETGEYVAPTIEEIKAECQKRWQQHLDRYAVKEDVSVYFE